MSFVFTSVAVGSPHTLSCGSIFFSPSVTEDVEVFNPSTGSVEMMSEVFVYVGDGIALDGIEEEAALQFRYQEELVSSEESKDGDGVGGGDGTAGDDGNGGEIAVGAGADAGVAATQLEGLDELIENINDQIGDGSAANTEGGDDAGALNVLIESAKAYLGN